MQKSIEAKTNERASLSNIDSTRSYINDAGRFKCPFPNCNKSFTRQEHLSRHKLNHWPKEIFRCSYISSESGLACNRTFVRKDLLARHEKRHLKRGGRLSNPSLSLSPSNSGNAEKNRRHSEDPCSSIPFPIRNPSEVADFPNVSELNIPGGDYQSQINTRVSNSSIPAVYSSNQPTFKTPGLTNIDERTGTESMNKFFNWLFDSNGSQQQQGISSGVTNKNLSPQGSNASPQNFTSGLLPNTSNLPFNDVVEQEHVSAQKSTSPLLAQPSTLDISNTFPQTQSPYETNASAIGINKMHDLFSLDSLNNDPLDALMQELSAPSMESQNSNGREATPQMHPHISIRAEAKCKDSHRADIKDNFEVQKSNILELQKQSPGTQKRSEGKPLSENSQNSLSFKKKVRSTMIPSFFYADPKTKYEISEVKCNNLFELIPDLRNVPIDNLRRSLLSFWLNFHPQYGLLHKPSFHVDEQPIILVLALIMMGASYLGSEYREKVCDIICTPLRWIIFSSEDFQPPSETYIIQSLLFLECYEKTSTSRYLHERSYLHHGTTIQLLRRTPSLGGHPLRLKVEEQPDTIQDPQEVYRRWIDCEMLKRVALYAFYMDTTHAAVFGYANLFINCNQVQLMLPCSDMAWESYDLSYEKLLDYGFGKERTTFLSALKQLLGEVIETLQNQAAVTAGDYAAKHSIKSWEIKSVLGRKVLLAGIISTLFQCQEANGDLLTSMTRGCLCDDEQINVSWQDILSFTINYWFLNIQKSLEDPERCFITSPDSIDEFQTTTFDQTHIANTDILKLDGPSCCKIPEFYMAQIMLRIFHHDYYIFGGAPWRMNVRTGGDEYAVAMSHIYQFASDTNVGDVALVYAYQFMFEMFVDEHTLKVDVDAYDPNSDYIITRPNTLALLTLLIWSCTFVLYGPEVKLWNNGDDDLTTANDSSQSNLLLKENYIPEESLEDHLSKMYTYLKIDLTSDVISYQNNIKKKASLLKEIKDRNNLCGMVKHMRDIYAKSYWDLGREFSRLFDNCFERSLGKESPTCENMYKV